MHQLIVIFLRELVIGRYVTVLTERQDEALWHIRVIVAPRSYHDSEDRSNLQPKTKLSAERNRSTSSSKKKKWLLTFETKQVFW